MTCGIKGNIIGGKYKTCSVFDIDYLALRVKPPMHYE